MTVTPPRVTGASSDSYMAMSAEQWAWLNELVRTAEVEGSFSPAARTATYGRRLGTKDDVNSMSPSWRKMADWASRINAVLSVSTYAMPYKWYAENRGWAARTEFPTLTRDAFVAQLTESHSGFSLAESMSVNAEEFNRLAYAARSFNYGSANRNSIIPGSSWDSFLYSTSSWHRNGAASASPETDQENPHDPFAHKNPSGIDRHTANFYYRVVANDATLGNVDYTYTKDQNSGAYYEIANKPWRYKLDGLDSYNDSYVSGNLLLGVWRTSLWAVRDRGSSVIHSMCGDKADFVALPHGMFEVAFGASTNINSVKSIGDRACELAQISSMQNYQPWKRSATHVYDIQRLIGWEVYVEPIFCLMRGRPQRRNLGV